MSAVPIQHPAIFYPESDGKPVGETDVHRREILQIIDALDRHFADRPDLYVSGNLMFYYEEGEPSSVISPDVFVVIGVPKGLRRTYKLWAEGRAPVFVLEITSRSTRLEDRGTKRTLYADLGVQEYFLFDPLDEYLRPSFQGFTLKGESYEALTPDQDGALISRTLNIRLLRDGTMLRMIDIATGLPILRSFEVAAVLEETETALHQTETALHQTETALHQTETALHETRAMLQASEVRAQQEIEARQAAEAELERLRQELERLRQAGTQE